MRVTDLKPYSVVRGNFEEKIKAEIANVVKPKMESMSNYQRRILSKGYRNAMFVLFLTIIIGGLMYLIRASVISSFTKELRRKIGDFEIYKEAITATDLATPERPAEISRRLHYRLRSNVVPSYASIIRTTEGLRGVTNKNTDFISNAVTFRWEEGHGKERQVYYYTQGMLIVGTDFFNNFEFNIQRQSFLSKVFRREKLQLENAEFEKLFSIMQNDELVLRQCFTPLIQENYVLFTRDVSLIDLRIIKVKDEIYVVWKTREDYLVLKNTGTLDASSEGIVKGIFKNLSRDLSEFYTALAYVISLPLFKNERTKTRDIGSDQAHERVRRSKIMRVIQGAALAAANDSSNKKK